MINEIDRTELIESLNKLIDISQYLCHSKTYNEDIKVIKKLIKHVKNNDITKCMKEDVEIYDN